MIFIGSGAGFILFIIFLWWMFSTQEVMVEEVMEEVIVCPECEEDDIYTTGRRFDGQYRCQACGCEFNID